MARAPQDALGLALLVAVAGAVGGCAATPPAPDAASAAVAAVPVPPRTPPPGSDWRTLPLAPFGSRLQELPIPVHEVLLFQDSSEPQRPEAECYAPDGPRRRFVGREVDSDLLCLRAGRLQRVEVSVSLPADAAGADFARYCDGWLAVAGVGAVRTPVHCSGAVPGGAAFDAALGDAAEGDTVPLLIVVQDTSSDTTP
jgi:hypothetical protein